MARHITLTTTLTLAGIISILTIQSQAAPVAPDQVRAMTDSFTSHSQVLAGRAVQNLRPLAWETTEPAFYLASLSGGGWMLVSGDDALVPVIGWSDQPLPSGDLPPAMINWLKGEELELLKLRDIDEGSQPARAQWESLLSGSGAGDTTLRTQPGEDVPPMIEANWNQGSTWNTDCPADAAGPAGHAYVGCVAVALAQVLDYWNWPQQGQNVQSYEHSVYGQLTVDFNQVNYDWNAITPTGSNNAVRQLLYHSGVSVRMNYGPGSSSAQSSMVVSALRNYFRYESTTRMVWRSSYTAATWQTLLHTELAAGRPVVYRGQGPTGGHAFNVDGVQDSSWFHINWGWGGSYNGYFLLTALSPMANRHYNDVQGAVVGIAPIGVAVNHPPVVASLFLQCQENQTLNTTLNGFDVDGDALTYRINGQTIAGNVWTWTPPLNANGTFTFTYQACDAGGCSQPADIVVQVASVNQLPTVPALAVECLQNSTISVTLSGQDADGDALTYQVGGMPIYGNIWSWTPAPNATGAFTFHYRACDASGCGDTASLVVTVVSTNQLPLAANMALELLEDEPLQVILAGYDPDGDNLSYSVNGAPIAGNIFNWTPEANMSGEVSFTYQACDGIGCSPVANLVVTVLAVNDAPVAMPVIAHLEQPGLQHIQLVAWDQDRDALSYVVNGQAIDSDIYDVIANPTDGDLSFNYYVTDGQANSDTVTVQLTFAPKDDPKPRHNPLISNRAINREGAAVEELPLSTHLQPAFPNPFNPTTTLAFDVSETGMVRLAVYNIAGQQVAELVNGLMSAGSHHVLWDASRMASGAYLATLQTAKGLETQILQLVK